MLNVHQLRILASVVEHGSLSRAAESLHLTQPAVSAQILHLRRFAGAPILARDGRRVVPTEAGWALYRYAEEVLRATDALRRELDDIVSGERDHFLVGSPLVYTTYVLPSIVARFLLAHPSVHLSVVNGSSPDILERVRAGVVDVGVVTIMPALRHLARDLLVDHLCDDEVVLIESVERPFSHGDALTLERLADIPFIGLSRPERVPQGILDRQLIAAGLEPLKTIMQLDTWEGIKHSVSAQVGVALVPRSVVQEELVRQELCLITVEGYRAARSVSLICSPHRQGARRSVVFDELMACLAEEIPRAVLRP